MFVLRGKFDADNDRVREEGHDSLISLLSAGTGGRSVGREGLLRGGVARDQTTVPPRTGLARGWIP
jgi:hypothetical protein